MIHEHLVWALPPVVVGLATAISGLASAAGTVASMMNKPKTAAAPTSTPASPPASQPSGTPTSNVPTAAPSFLAAASTPQSGQTAGKTLLGQ